MTSSVVRSAQSQQEVNLETYILRIFRRDRNVPHSLAGLVEEVGVEGGRAFRNVDELWSILDSSKAEPVKMKKRNKCLRDGEQRNL